MTCSGVVVVFFLLCTCNFLPCNSFLFQRLSPEELRRRSSSIDSTSKDSVCGICLEELGPKCVGSCNPHCMHLYHEECIVSWLAPRQHWLCPICRQVFLLNPSLQSSTAATVTGTCPSTTDHMSTTAFSEQDDSLTIPTSGEEDVGEHPFPHSIQDPIEEEEIESTDDSAIGDAVPQDSRSAGTTSITDDEEDYDDVDASAQCSNNTVPL
jgi:Ring finger domain